MRNIDYRALYEKVKEREGRFDKLTTKERNEKEIKDNKARDTAVKLAKKGIGTGKKGVAPTAPPNLPVATEENFLEKCQMLIDEGYCKDMDDVNRLFTLLG